MKILIVNNMQPFVWGGAEELAVNLKKNLIACGHEVEILRIPFQWDPATVIPSQMLMVQGFMLHNVDRVIALKFPAYLIQHPHKTLWLLHQYRQAYDLYDAGQTNLGGDETSQKVRRMIHNADNQAFHKCKKIYTNSEVTQKRLQHYNQFDSEVLYPPLNNPELFTGSHSEGYIFAGGRISRMKRQYLLIEALALASKNMRLVIAGPPDHSEDAKQLVESVEKFGLKDRVKLELRFLTRQEIAHYVNHAAACAYLPYDEDSLGYVSMEAAAAAKPIITTHDSGGILGLVEHLQTGWVAAPTPKSLAAAMNQVNTQPGLAKEFGINANQLWINMGINWQNTIEKLLYHSYRQTNELEEISELAKLSS